MRGQTGSTTTIILLACVVVLFIGLSGAIALMRTSDTDKNDAYNRSMSDGTINSFEECAAAGNPVQESYPERCVTPEGKAFVNTKAKTDSNKP